MVAAAAAAAATLSQGKVWSVDAKVASQSPYDIAIIGAGIIGSALAYSLSESGRSILLLERDLVEPDRIVGELLQPGGCLALQQLGISDTLADIDAVPCEGYKVFWGDEQVAIPYPPEEREMGWKDGRNDKSSTIVKQEGRSFHHGRFVMNLRRKAASSKGVTIVEATVNNLQRQGKRIVGVCATPKGGDEQLDFRATLTIVVDGCMSKFRRQILPSHITPIVRSHFVGIVLEDADLPAPHHGHVILGKADRSSSSSAEGSNSLGPVLVYQLSTHDTRMLIDIRGTKAPSTTKLPSFLRQHVTPVLPPSIVPSFEKALQRAESGDKEHRLRSMPNSFLPPYPQGREIEGAFLAGDSLNMRHPLTGGGMTVAMNDTVLLTQLLGGGKQVGEIQSKEEDQVVDLHSWWDVHEKLEDWHWERKKLASCINVLAMALYSLFGAEDENLEVLKTGCFKYFELGGDCIAGPVSLLSALTPSPLLLFYHFFRVAFYSIYTLFQTPIITSSDPKGRPVEWTDYPALTVKSAKVFWTACVVLLPFLWGEGQM
ncbi:BZ3500_MvSof-1268-A1-R1_Chr8-2g10203 [Microbotryum saponariae]|uniref:Squalene monooxygenase n=1 Tax=Microbotryum saponariae TaxID=289078 RepID=A0A2X0MV24_9BASI|nr:BZ3500_MvSof-1268-A1-R1_Chr8-2g10203 [Microbotryum saponariae]